MRGPVPERRKQLMAIYEPYVTWGKDGTVLREDAPEEARKAFEEFRRLGEEEWKHRYDPDWF